MPKYLIEVPHEPETIACAKAVQIFLETGSHYLSNAEWGCLDGVHKSWILMEAEDKEQARLIIPPNFRRKATIIQLNRFTMEEIETILAAHEEAET